MKKRFSGLHIACALCAFLGVSFSAFSTIDIAAIQMDIESATWYTPSQFQLVNFFDETVIQIEQGDIRSASSVAYDYAFEGTVEITPSQKYISGASGGVITGAFWDGTSTMTVMANHVWDIDDPGTDILTNVTLLTAQMSNNAGYWFLNELTTPNDFSGETNYEITGGELFNGSVMQMNDFIGIFSFPTSTPYVTDLDQPISASAPAIDLIDPNPIPEPATMLLLGLGGLLMRKK